MKTICIYHSRDLDGWMSGAIAHKWFHEQINDGLYVSYGWDYGDKIPDLSMYDRVIMVDVSFPVEVMIELSERLRTKVVPYTHNFIWIDHHQSAIDEVGKAFQDHYKDTLDKGKGKIVCGGSLDSKFAACELAWMHFFPEWATNPPTQMPELVRLLGRYDCFGHKGTDEEQKVLEF